MKTVLFVTFVLLLSTKIQAEDDWWEYGHFYQIYPRSFQDSDGDGIGDLHGITMRLPYLKYIGVTGVWLCSNQSLLLFQNTIQFKLMVIFSRCFVSISLTV